jgi:hypothetical protein
MLSPAVRKLAVEKCESEKPDSFEKVFEIGECHVAPWGSLAGNGVEAAVKIFTAAGATWVNMQS